MSIKKDSRGVYFLYNDFKTTITSNMHTIDKIDVNEI